MKVKSLKKSQTARKQDDINISKKRR